MTASIRSIRKRLLECLDRKTLEHLSDWEHAPRRGRATIIEYILDGEWTESHDRMIQSIVDSAKSKQYNVR